MVEDSKYHQLRQQAEKLLQEKGIEKPETYYNDIDKLVEELNLHQIELEMQNQKLKESNQKLIEEQNRYKELYMNAPVAYFNLNETGNIIELNYAAADLLNTPIESFRYTSIFPYLHESSKNDFARFYKTAFNSTKTEYGEIIFTDRDGNQIHSSISAIATYDNHLEKKIVRCTVTDLSKTKQFEKNEKLNIQLNNTIEELNTTNEELNTSIIELNAMNDELNAANLAIQRERKQFLSILNSIPEAIYVSNMVTNEILFVNQHLKNQIGRDITGEKCHEAIQGKKEACNFCTNKNIKDSNEPWFWEYYNPVLKTHFYIMDRKIQWSDNQEVRFEMAIDITERKKAEIEIKKLNIAIEQNPATIVITDLSGNIEYTNPAFEKTTGYTKEEAIGKNPRILKTEKTSPEVYKELWKTITRGKTWHGQFVNKTKSGKEYIEKAIIAPIFDNEGKKIRYVAIKEDITEKVNIENRIKRNEEKLRQSEEKYRLIAENASDVIWILNLSQKKFTYISPSVYNLRGYTPEEALNQDINQSLTPESAQKVLNSISEILPAFLANPAEETKKVYQDELQQPCKDGSIIWIETSTRYQFNADNEVEVIGISRNIDDRKKHEQLIAKRLRYEENLALFSNTLMLNETDVITKSLKYLLDAANCARVYIFENFMDSENQLSMKQTHEVCAKGVEPQLHIPELQHLIYQKDGFERWYEELPKNNIISGIVADFPAKEREILSAYGLKSIMVIPIWVDGKWFGFMGFDEINEEKNWDSEDVDLLRTSSEMLGLYISNQLSKTNLLHTNKELEEAVATKDRFISILGHDLKSPFTSIMGFSDLIVNDNENYNLQDVRRFASLIHGSAKQAFNLLDNMLGWAKSQRDETPFNPKQTNLLEIIDETYSFVNNTAMAKNINLAKSVFEPIYVEVDKEMIKTVIRNLISNAIKYTHANGTIVISANKKENNVEIEVEDNGTGMNETTKNSLFKIGKTTSIKGTAGEKGTGFGLLLCKDFVDKHNGQIRVESQLGKGSRFIVTIPLQQK
jgi:PAS domain S-box-containing protein